MVSNSIIRYIYDFKKQAIITFRKYPAFNDDLQSTAHFKFHTLLPSSPQSQVLVLLVFPKLSLSSSAYLFSLSRTVFSQFVTKCVLLIFSSLTF